MLNNETVSNFAYPLEMQKNETNFFHENLVYEGKSRYTLIYGMKLINREVIVQLAIIKWNNNVQEFYPYKRKYLL